MNIRVNQMDCVAQGCERLADVMREPGPLCNLHYQRWITRGTLASAPKRSALTKFHCAECGKGFERSYSMKLSRKSGPQYCSSACLTLKGKRKAAEHAEARFWAKVNRKGPEECWEWQGHRARHGYGRVTFRKGETQMAHRVAYLLANGSHPRHLFVCHRCDNPPCCNPSHLFLGTHAENMRDMVAKGRSGVSGIKGEAHPQARMDAETAIQVYRSPEPNKIWAKRLGVTAAAIYNIRHGKSWAHVTGAQRG